jgi:predicted nucleotidyltransferase
MPTKNLIDSLLPKARQLILKELFLNGQREIHLRELARRTGMHPKTIQVEVKNLLGAGIILEEKSGNQKLYRINKSCPLISELSMIIIKTVGVADQIRKALKPLEKRIYKAYVFGSFASGEYDSLSDIDILVVGSASLKDVVGVISDSAMMLGRVINPITFSKKEYLLKKKKDGFLKRIEGDRKIMLYGDENDA